jgi:phage tail-like protein
LANGIPPKRARTADPPFTGRFKVLIGDLGEIGAFTEITGLSVDVEVEEVKEGGQNQFSHRLPGRMKWPNIVLKRGVTDNNKMFEWFQKTAGEGFTNGKNVLELEGGSIVLVDGQGKVVRSWSVSEAFPIKWTGPTLAASSTALAVEELEIAHHGFRPG